MTPTTRWTPHALAVFASASVAGPGTSIALSKYRLKTSRPSGVRIPTRAPKSSPFGYADTNASGNTTSAAPARAASAVRSPILTSVAAASKTTGAFWTTAATNLDMGTWSLALRRGVRLGRWPRDGRLTVQCRPMHRLARLSAAVLLPLCPVALLAADDWPHWRGPLASGVSPDQKLPIQWSATQNVVWKAPIG